MQLNSTSTTPGAVPDQDWTVEEAAKTLGLSRGAIIRRLEDGILPGYKVKRGNNSAWRVKPTWLKERVDTSLKLELQDSKTLEPGNTHEADDTVGKSTPESVDVEFDFSPDSNQEESPLPTKPSKIDLVNEDFIEVYESDEETNDSAAMPLSKFKELIELRTRLEIAETQSREAREKLENANYKIGYLEARLESNVEQLRLLTVNKESQSWWQSFCHWFKS